MENNETMRIYFDASPSESSEKQYLARFAMMSLLSETVLLDMKLVLTE